MTDYSPSYRGKPGTWCRACFAAYKRGARQQGAHEARTCAWCGQQYVPRQLKAAAAYCSRPCKTRARNAREKATRDAAKDERPARICPHCGQAVPILARIDAVFCTSACNTAARNLPRKLRARGAPAAPGLTRAGIAERDDWRCGICGDPVDSSLRWPHLWSATLDHIVPVAAGGKSDPSNLRLAHLTCNARRSNRASAPDPTQPHAHDPRRIST